MKLFAVCASLALFAGSDDSFLIRNVTVHPVSGPEIAKAMVLVTDGKIAGVGAKLSAGKGVKIVDGKDGHLWPGLINSATELGLREISSVRETVDTGELGVFNPQLRALIAVNPESEFIPVTRANGITTVITMPSSGSTVSSRSAGAGALIPGQVSMLHLEGWTWEEMEIRRAAAMQLIFPTVETRTFNRFEMAPGRTPYAEAKKFFDKRIKDLNDYFDRARAYQKSKAASAAGFNIDLALEAMLPVLDGKMPLMIHAQDQRTIKAAIEFVDKQKVKAILANVQRPGNQIPEIAKRRIPVIVVQASALPEEEDDPYDKNFSLPGELHKAGIKFSFGTFDTQFARNLPFEAGLSAGYGLPPEIAVKAITLHAAEIWGVDSDYGSIDPGKSADLILTDGDILEHRTQVKSMWIQGRPVDLENKHTRLYEKYSRRP